MYSARQLEILAAISEGLPALATEVEVEPSPGYIDSVVEVHDFAVAALGAIGSTVAQIGDERGLGPQRVRVDRRHAGLLFNAIAYFFQGGWQFDISAVHTPVNAFYRTRDERLIFFNGAYAHLRDGLLRLLDCPSDAAAIARQVARLDAQALEDEATARGLCAAIVRAPEEWLAHPQGRALAGTPPIRLTRLGESAPRPFSRALARPLERIRVLDFTHVVAGPTVSQLLAEHGADVIHCRYPYLDHILGFDLETSFGKKNTYVDLRLEADRARILALAEECDVFVQGFRWGALAKLGLGPEDLRRANPSIVYVDVNAYGFEGPWAGRRGWEQLAQVATGLASVHSAGRPAPALIPAYFNDYGTGCLGALGVLAALRRRAHEGGSWNVQVSLARTAMLGLQFSQNREAAVPIADQDLNRYLVDQDSPLGLLTRVAPGMQLSQTPAYVERPGTFPGSASLDIGWGPDPILPHAPPHRPTSIFSLGLARWRGSQVL